MTSLAALLLLSGAMTDAADTFLKSLEPEQRARAQLRFEDPQRTRWHYTGGLDRRGLPLGAMTAKQRPLAMHLLRAAMSKRGFEKATTAMSLETELGADPGGPIHLE